MSFPDSAPAPAPTKKKESTNVVCLTIGAIALLLGIFGRLMVASVTPPFIDESIHISVAITPELTDKWINFPARFANGKYTGYFVYEILHWTPASDWAPEALFLHARYTSIAFFVLTIGTFFAIGQSLKLRWFGPLSSVLWAATPLALLHEGLAVHDPLGCWFIALGVLLSIRAFRLDHRVLHLATGLAFGLAVTTKVTNLAVTPFVLAGGILLGAPYTITWGRAKKLILWWSLGFFLPIVPAAIYVAFQWNELVNAYHWLMSSFLGSRTQDTSKLQTILATAVAQKDIYIVYGIGALLGGTIISSVLCPPPKSGAGPLLRLLVCLLPFLAILVLSNLFSRYYLCLLVPCIIALTYNLTLMWEQGVDRARRMLALLLALALSLYSVAQGLRLFHGLQSPTTTTALTARDRAQYFYGWSSGAGIDEVARFLSAAIASSKAEVFVAVHSGAIGHANLTLPHLLGAHRKSCVMVDLNDWKSVEQFTDSKPGSTKYYVLEDSPLIDQKRFQLAELESNSQLVFQALRPMGVGSYKVFKYEPGSFERNKSSLRPVLRKTRGFFSDGWSETEFRITVINWGETLALELRNPTPLHRTVELGSQAQKLTLEIEARDTRNIQLSVAPSDVIKCRISPAFIPGPQDPRELGLLVGLPAEFLEK